MARQSRKTGAFEKVKPVPFVVSLLESLPGSCSNRSDLLLHSDRNLNSMEDVTLELQKLVLSFPPEIWANIAADLPGEQLGRLKLTGCKPLWRKICSMPHLESIIIGLDLIVFQKWPAFLNEIPRILSLEIHDPTHFWFANCDLKLDRMPATLRKLKLNIPTARLDDFFHAPDRSLLRLDVHTPVLEILDLSLDWRTPVPWLVPTPASLTTLKIYHWHGCQPLPASLNHFFVEWSNSIPDFNFPPNLESFVCQEFTIFGFNPTVSGHQVRQLTSKFPTSLRRFKGEIIDRHVRGDDLPRSLTALQGIPCTVYPSSLTILECATPIETWATLPTSLTVLKCEIERTRNDPMLRILPVQHLPKAITSLRIRCLQNELPTVDFDDSLPLTDLNSPLAESSTVGIFPPFLRTLKLHSANISESAARQLPPSLTVLDVHHFDHIVAKHIPSKLTSLRCITMETTHEVFESLPNSLTDFCVFHDQLNNLPTWKANFKSRLNQQVNPLQWCDEYHLPASLIALTLKHVDGFGDSFLKLGKLPLLETLDVPGSHMTDLGIPLLPRCLTYLNLDASTQITGNSFKDLPTNLRVLKLSSAPQIFDSDISFLPRHLKILNLDSAVQLTELCVIDFPRSLSHLSLEHNQLFSNDHIWLISNKQDLPKRILAKEPGRI